MNKKTILWILALLVLVSQSFALGIAPGHKDVVFEPNMQFREKMKITNNDQARFTAVLYAQGELAEYIEFEQVSVDFSDGAREKYVYYNMKLPESFDKKGLHQADIVVRSVPLEQDSDGIGVSASVAVISKLNIMVPYTGKYVEIELFSPHFESGKQSNFAVEVKNLGTEDVLQAQAIIDIYGPLNEKIDTVYSDIVKIDSKDKELLIAKWTPTVPTGSYYAVATVVYDEFNIQDRRDFAIGTLTIDVVDVSVTDFTLGGIAQFDILLSSNWNLPVNEVYAETTIKDEVGKSYAKFKTASVNIPAFGKQRVESYWDTTTVGPGKYKMDITLNYLDQKTERIFDILVSLDAIQASPVGQLIGAQKVESADLDLENIVFILAFLVVLLIAFNIFIYLKKLKK